MVVFLVSAFVLFGLLSPTTCSSSSTEQNDVNDSILQTDTQRLPVTWPSLKLHVKMKRKKMKLHGESSYHIYANPVVSNNGTHVEYDAYATFADGDSEFTYTVYQGAAYVTTKLEGGYETVRCIPPHTLPLNSFLPALNRASPIPSATLGDKQVECPSGKLFKTTFIGTHYAICASSTGFEAISSDLDVSFEYLPKPIKIKEPELTNMLDSECKILEKPIRLTPIARALVTGTELPSSTSRHLKAASAMSMHETKCTCKSRPRPCLFFHGAGNAQEFDDLKSTPGFTETERIGDMHGHAPCCSKIKYSVLNTVDHGWTDESLQEKYCDHMLRMSKKSDKVKRIIKDTIVVTHSMAGNVLAGALANKKCSFSSTVSWVSSSPPMLGSMGCDYVVDVCSKGLINEAAELVGTCPMSESRKTTVYQKGEHCNSTLYTAYTAAQKAYRDNVGAAICSDTYFGLFSKYQARAIIGGTVLPHKTSKNDGLVEYSSCLGGLSPSIFGDHYLDTFYKAKLNHADTAFLAGDGLLSDAQKPVKWFECLAL